MAVANLEDPSALAHLIAGALRIKVEEKQALLEEVDVGKRLRRLSEVLARELDIVAIGSKIQSQVMSEMESSQRDYVLRQQLKAIQEELGEKDPAEAEMDDLREQLAELDLPEDVRKQADRELSRLREAPAGRGRARRHPHLPGVDRVAAVGQAHRRQPRPRARPRGARRRPLRHRQGQGPDPRVPGGAQAQAGRAGLLDHVLRRPARRRQDVAGQVDRARHGPQVRAHLRRRRARRGRDPRPPAHLHRRDAGDDHPRAARRGRQEPAVHDRRDRQDGRRLPRRPRERDARGARPRAERVVPRSLPRRARSTSRGVLFITTANTLDTIPPPLRDRMEIIQLAGYTEEEKLQIAKRYLVPRQIDRSGLKRSQIAFTDAGLKTIIGDYTREAGVRGLEREIASACRKVALSVAEGTHCAQGVGDRAEGARAARPRRASSRTRSAARPSRASPPAWRGRRSAATCCSSRRRRCRARAS